MAHLKLLAALALVVALALLLCRRTRAPLSKLLRALLWAGCALTASTGAVVLGDAQGNPVALAGGGLLLAFSAYAAATARAVGKKSAERPIN